MADYGTSGQDYGGYHGDISGGNYGAGNPRDPYGGGDPNNPQNKNGNAKLPAEYASMVLPDGRLLGDVLGPGYFGAGGRLGNNNSGVRGDPAVVARVMAELRAQSNRLGATQTILGGKPPTAGKAGQASSHKPVPASLANFLATAGPNPQIPHRLLTDLILSRGA